MPPSRGVLTIVPGERHVERLAREGQRAETRTALLARLTAALLPNVAFLERRECRLLLAMALEDADSAGPGQLGLFGGVAPDAAPPAAQGDALLASVRARGGASWARMIAALDDAIGRLRSRGATVEHLDRVAKTRGFLGARARTLAAALRALDARLARAGAVDARLAPTLCASAILDAKAEAIDELLGARSIRARWIYTWEPADLSWWRALDDRLGPLGGEARVVLPSFDRPLAPSRERDPLDEVAEDVARGLDGPAESETIAMVLGDLTGALGDAPDAPADGAAPRVRLVSAGDPVAQARAVAVAVDEALAAGAAVERVVVALPAADERTLAPLRRALEERGIVTHESRGAPPSEAPVVAGALLAIDAATSLDRGSVARLLRSGWLDAARVTGDESRRVAERRLSRLAKALETAATAAGDDPAQRIIVTATAPRPGSRAVTVSADTETEHARDALVITRLVQLLTTARAAATRVGHVHAARLLWASLGIGARAGRGGLASFTSDEAPVGVPRAERLAIARDARAWDALVSALDLYEATAQRAGALEQRLDAATFRLELLELLDAAVSQPGAGRAGAVRLTRLADVAGEALDLLVVLDANEGVLPREETRDALVSESFAEALTKASRNAFRAPRPGLVRARELTALAACASEAQRIVLTFLQDDGAGSPLAPSFVVDTLVRAGVSVVPAPPEARRVSGVETRVRALRERARETFFLDPARPRSAVVGDVAPTELAAQLLTAATGGADRALAVTSLERFAKCAFQGYARVVLAAQESLDTEELPDAREEGTLLHAALASAFVATRELWPRRPRSEDDVLTRGEAAASAVLAAWQGHAPLRAVVRLRVRDAVRAVLVAALADDTWDFTLAEQPFGDRSPATWPTFVLDAPPVTLRLRGSIDRVDRSHDGRGLRVIDYKRSKSTAVSSNNALGETALQVPLYARVAEQALGVPATGAYLATQARDVASWSKPNAKAAARMDELVARAPGAMDAKTEIERRALELVMSARAGHLAPLPASEAECRLCAFSGGCRKPRFAMEPEDLDEESGIPPLA